MGCWKTRGGKEDPCYPTVQYISAWVNVKGSQVS